MQSVLPATPSGANPPSIQRAAAGGLAGRVGQMLDTASRLSGTDIRDAEVNLSSTVPAQFEAEGITRGRQVHLATGAERHLGHELWHVVQQAQGRVRADTRINGQPANTDPDLEREADVMGAKLSGAAAPPAQRMAAQRMAAPAATPARTAGSGGTRVAVRSAPEALPAGLALQMMLVKVRTLKPQMGGPRVISALDVEGRVPTSVSGGQGDHTVAETLAVELLRQNVVGRVHADVAPNIARLFSHIDEEIIARVQQEDGTYAKIGSKELSEAIAQYSIAAGDPSTEGEDLNTMLEGIVEIYLRLWNKRMGSAYDRKRDNKTSGGGKEKQAIKTVRMSASSSKIDEEVSPQHLLALQRDVHELIDFKLTRIEDIGEAAEHIHRAIEMVLDTVQHLEFDYNDFATDVVRNFCLAQRIPSDVETELDRLVFNLLRGEDDSEEYWEEDVVDMGESSSGSGTKPNDTNPFK